jgi:hypothetical protein
MSFPKQDSVMARLQAQSIAHINRVAARRKADVFAHWARASRLLKADIAAAYSGSAGHGGTWDLTAFHSSGNYHMLAMRTGAVLTDLLKRTTYAMRSSFMEIKDLGRRRQAWALAQVVPHPERIKFHNDRKSREANVPLTAGFEERWSEWVKAYHSALMGNLRMNALRNGTVTDAIAEVDATRADTPAYTLDAALDRIWEYEAWDAMTEGMGEVADDNPGEAQEEIWRTSGDLRVCDDCDGNEGETAEDADGTIPLHPNCNCFYQLVPASFAELLRSGDEDDRDLARQMDAEGIAPNAIVIRDKEGGIMGRAIVDFDDWEEARGLAVAGQ